MLENFVIMVGKRHSSGKYGIERNVKKAQYIRRMT